MRKAICVVTYLLGVLAAAHTALAESTWEFAVQLSAGIQTSPAQITLSWPQDTYMLPNSYTVYRRARTDLSWGAGTTLPGTTTSFIDNNITAGTGYEYQVIKSTSQYTGYGYVYAGMNLPLVENRGKVLLVVDNTFTSSLATELSRLQTDLNGDGWTVARMDVSRNDSVASVKGQIKAQYLADPANIKAVFLFGHVPVPYSGDIVPDGHVPDHQGAWPCDGYYGDMDGNWTDSAVNDSSASDPRTRNTPGDGKFDQSTFPAPLKLMVGRVDLANMPGRLTWGGAPTFPSELELLRNYLNKDHKFRHKQFDLPRRAILADFFGNRDGEAFVASGWRNYATFFGPNNLSNLDSKGAWASTLSSTPSLCAYGSGAGSYTSIAGLGSSDSYNDVVTTELVSKDIKSAFVLMFGSWLGDWDSEDNILRAVLALPSYGLASAWSGRPHWYLHHMALGEPIGFSARLTQNNGASGAYQNQLNSCAGQSHIALMGDPTLRLHTVAPAGQLTGTSSGSTLTLNWTASSDHVLGYHVYKASGANTSFTRLTTTPLPATTFTDNSAAPGMTYMVRAVTLETSASGSYFNASQGVFYSNGSSVVVDNPPPPNPQTNSPTGPSLTNAVVWFDDTLPAGAIAGADGGETWNWVNSNPTPISGALANQSILGSGLHQHYFSYAAGALNVNAGDVLFAWVYLDPNNIPNELMLQWNDGIWEHRAYWGANYINYGTDGSASRRYMGGLPRAGQWTLLQVPASFVGLEGRSVNGMSFTLYNGRATWDYCGKSGSSVLTNPPATGGGNSSGGTTPNPNGVFWVDDSLPAGAVPGAEGEDWNWVTYPTPVSGSVLHQSTVAAGLHQHFFTSATSPLNVNSGDTVCAYTYIDPANIPTELMLQWFDGTWEHRAYWGADNIAYGTYGTPGHRYIGPLPPAGQWVRLEVSARLLGLEGSSVTGMAFSQYNGRVSWDAAGKNFDSTGNTAGGNTTTNNPTVSTNTTATVTKTFWLDDDLPAGAVMGSEGGDTWNWISSNPGPAFGSVAHEAQAVAGLHQHYFSWATKTLSVKNGDVLFAYVYLDPSKPPSELMLQWNDGTWEHRAYWGNNKLTFGVNGTVNRRYMGVLPATGKWVCLQVPASQVALEGSTLNGLAFTCYDGRVVWDAAGTASGFFTNAPVAGTSTTNQSPVVTSTSVTTGTVTDISTDTVTNTPSGPNASALSLSALPGVSLVDGLTPQIPSVGANALHILSPNLLELVLINSKQPDPAQVSQWNLVDANSQFTAPPVSAFNVTADGKAVAISSVGFKRRPLYAPIAGYDLRVGNYLYLKLATPLADNQSVEVKNPDGSLWATTMYFATGVDPLRYSPAIHVNQEGYMPGFVKKAMVGYYAGNLGEVPVTAAAFKLVDAATGVQVYEGSLTSRKDTGYSYSPTPYQKVYEADFTTFNTPGEYRLVVSGLGGSLPFLINGGVAMAFARAYALGLYHQRCGTNTALPYTRFTHGVCHNAPATVPMPASSYAFTWNTIAGYANTLNENNQPQIAAALISPSTSLFPFVGQSALDVSGGHHDAGDYSKYTINSASLIHYLMFEVDSLSGIADLDNLGTPESGDGISDILQEAKWEADFLAKMQDTDGGFYFLVYPQDREYEGSVTPDHGDAQVVWPKTTSATGASVAALAQCASSPAFKKAYPAAAALYLQKAQLGWQFLLKAINQYGQNGAYQKITHYGDDFADHDEFAWAACQMYLATGDATIHQKLLAWFDPADPATWRWGWWHMPQCYGHAIRSYAFAVQSGRLTSSQLNATFLGKCNAQIASAAEDVLSFSQQNAYGSSFPLPTKAVRDAGWYFSCDQAFDLAVAYQLNPKQEYINALLANMNFEAGCNPVNVTYVTGLGWKRQRDIVNQWALNDARVLPPSGIPVGNITGSFNYLWNYQGQLQALCYPSDAAATAPYPFYDRWGDSWNVNAEMVVINQARGLGAVAFLAAQTAARTQSWKAKDAQIVVPTNIVPVGGNVTVTLRAPGVDLTSARITWEARDQEPAYGQTFSFTPTNNGTQWVEAEAQLPDGRRVFAANSFMVNSSDVVWFDDSVPAGASTGTDGGDSWTWVSSDPVPSSGNLAHQSAIASGQHQHYFIGATATLTISTGDVLYAYVYLDPANPPSEIMLQWNDGSWEHRAYWGANTLHYGTPGTPSRVYIGGLPKTGQWIQLKVAAKKVGLEGKIVSGMSFTAYGGRVTWDVVGRLGSSGGSSSSTIVNVVSATNASRVGPYSGAFTLSRTGDSTQPLSVSYSLGGTASTGIDYAVLPSAIFPAGSSSVTLNVTPIPATNFVGTKSIVVTLNSSLQYTIGSAGTALMTMAGNTVQSTVAMSETGPKMTWQATSSRHYRVAYKNNLQDPEWIAATELTADHEICTWIDTAGNKMSKRFYLAAQID